ncbi:MAG TPA: ABC transporter permease [Actinocrinis sp.]|nr:ABC transporter permease [Actinocrinis sp.]
MSTDISPQPTPPVPPPAEPAADGAPGGLALLVRNVFTAENGALVTFLAIVLALVVGAVLIVVSDSNAMDELGYFTADPGAFFSTAWHDIANGYSALFRGAVFDPATITGNPAQFFTPIANTLEFASPLIFGGLAVSVAFRAGLFNIGGQGQLIAGAICSSYVAFTWTALPGAAHLIVAVLAGMLGGLAYAAIVGWLKAERGAHEVIVTIMLNYVLYLLLGSYLLTTAAFHDPKNPGQAISKPADRNAVLPHLFGDSIPTDLGLLLALVATFATAWFLQRSKLGFEVRAVGLNPAAARTAGISVGKVQIAAMSLSGLLFGLVGVTQVLGTLNPNNNSLGPNIDAGLGFNAITVALLGRTRPWGVVGAAILFGGLEAGGAVMQTQAGIPNEIINILQALIVIFVAAPQLIKEVFRLRAARIAPRPRDTPPPAGTPAATEGATL